MRKLLAHSLVVLFCFAAVAAHAEEKSLKPLPAYVAKPDASYQWTERSRRDVSGTTVVELIMTSQTWRDIPWRHQLVIFKPQKVEGDQAVLLISGGNWSEKLEGPAGEGESLPREAAVMANLSRQIGAPVALLSHVPFQPIFDGLVEDEIIAYTFDQYLKSQDPEWPLLLPMVKSAVRAMDTVQQIAKQEWSIPIEHFTVTGASKRGWTTWLVGAVDKRATAIAPIVIDALNMSEQMKHQLDTWGEYSEQIEDYTKRGIQGANQTTAGKALAEIIDPYSYRDILTQPKLLIMGTNDRYWTLDALNIYWDDLVGEKHVLYVPNNGHGINDLARVVGSISALHKQAVGRLKLPNLSWDIKEADGKLRIVIKSDQSPTKVLAWTASSPTKDFREAKWTSTPAESQGGQYVCELAVPAAGHAAMFGEAVYQADGQPFFLSTNVRIVGAGQPAAAGGQ